MCLVPVEGEKQCMGSPRTGITDDCERHYVCLESNLGPPLEQGMLLTAEPSLQPLDCYAYFDYS